MFMCYTSFRLRSNALFFGKNKSKYKNKNKEKTNIYKRQPNIPF